MGIHLPPAAITAFGKYFDLLGQRGQNVNLTAITGAQDVAQLHFLDSLALLGAYDFRDAHVIDVGSGAGFPGVPLKIAEPSIMLTLMDATRKRVEFLSELCMELPIDAACLQARAEEAARSRETRERYDIVVSRAVARLNLLCELCLPLVRPGGVFIAMKGPEPADELAEARSAIITLGAEPWKCIDYMIPGTEIARTAVLISKTTTTPDKYPRRYAKMQKAPL